MNKYILANSNSPTRNILPESTIKSFIFQGFSEESTPEAIVASGYILLPELPAEPTDTEVTVAKKDDSGAWTLINIPSIEWDNLIKDTRTAAIIRRQRNSLLTASDWTQAYDIPASISEPWATYRQALRDIPQQPGFPNFITWPTQPR